MAKLVLSLDGSITREIALGNDRVTIGRKPTNDIQIDDLAVSGDHALIAMIYNDWILEDLGSTNGTLVNGASVKKHILRTNDQIVFGRHSLKFVGGDPDPQPAAAAIGDDELEKTIMVRASAPRPARPATKVPARTGMLERIASWFKSRF